MWEFLQSYGIWIVFGALFLFMMRAHGHGSHGGGGCGMGGGQHSGHGRNEAKPTEAQETVDEGRGPRLSLRFCRNQSAGEQGR